MTTDLQLNIIKRFLASGETTWEDVCKRVSTYLEGGERLYEVMVNGEFSPATPALMNSGTDHPQLSACFVIPTEDSLDSIMQSGTEMALTFKSGGGVGFNLSSIRPKGTPVGSTGGTSPSIVDWMSMYDGIANAVKNGARRRGALMVCCDFWNANVVDFINSKAENGKLSNMNISVIMRDEDMKRIDLDLPHPCGRTSKQVWNLIVSRAHKGAEPGLLFIDRALRDDPRAYGTNPSLISGTMIPTLEGMCPIETLVGKEFFVYGEDDKPVRATCRKSGDNVPVVTINNIITCTPQHKWPVYNKRRTAWEKKPTSELNIGDVIPTGGNICPHGKEGTYNEGFFIGYWKGDGAVTVRKDNGRKQWYFCCNPRKEAFLPVFKEITGRDMNNSRGYFEASLSSRELTEFFERFGIVDKLSVPDVNQVSDDFMRGFVAGWFYADGSTKGNSVLLTTTQDPTFIAQVLGMYGLVVRVHKRVIDTHINGHDYNREAFNVHVSNGVKFNDVFGVSRFNCSKGVGFSVGMRVNSIEDAGTADVYDITVDCESHVYNLGFCITANCGEQWLPPYGNCNLGSVNLAACVDEGVMEDEALYQISKIAARALYVACQKNQLPLPAMMEENREHPRIGLGVVGLAEALIKVGVRYGSEESLVLAKKWLGVIRMAAMDELRHEKCEAFLSIAPTGSLSTIMGTSAGIEPYFAFITKRHIMDRDFIEIATCYEEAEDKSVCVTAHEVTPEEHVRMLAACQEIVDNSISKTVNMPETATKADVDEIYRLAWKLGCKGITIYREGSRDAPIESLKPEDVYTCPECGNKQIRDGAHCIQCSNCGFQQCG